MSLPIWLSLLHSVRLEILFRLTRVTSRQQPHRYLAGEGALDDRRGTGQQQNLFGFVARVVDNGHAGVVEAKAGPARNRDHRREPVAGRIPSPSGMNALVDAQRHRRVVARHGQRRRVDEGGELELVVSHREVPAVGRQTQILRILRHRERHARFELLRIHGVAELHRRHELLQVGIARILIELALGDAGGKRLAPELEGVLRKLDLSGEQALVGQAYRECAIDGPIILRRELKFLVGRPEPRAGDGGRDLDAGRHRLLQLRQAARPTH